MLMHSSAPPPMQQERYEAQAAPTPSSSAASNDATPSPEQQRIIETDDPDIQILEGIGHSGHSNQPSSSSSTTFTTRKRPHGTAFKDHSKNILFKTTLQEHIQALAAKGLAVNQHQAVALRLRYIAEHAIRSLNEYGWAVVDNFLGKAHCHRTYDEAERLYTMGMFSAGQLMDDGGSGSGGGGASTSNDTSSAPTTSKGIRSDEICWFDSADERAKGCVTVRLLISMIDSVIVHFKERIEPYTISGRSKAMIAVYPGNGTRYVKHIDNPVRDGRCITAIYYCNEDWKLAEHGGTLRLYPASSAVPMDIDPQADRLVFFFSDRRNPHEVLPVFRPRFAITIWYFDLKEKLKALEEKRKRDEGSGGGGVRGGGASSARTSSPAATGPCPTCGHSSKRQQSVASPPPPLPDRTTIRGKNVAKRRSPSAESTSSRGNNNEEVPADYEI